MNLNERLTLAMAGPPKVTQTALAKHAKVAQASVNDWLSGKTKTIRGGTLLAVARFLNVSADWLATGKGQMRPPSLAHDPLHVSMSSLRDELTPDVIAEAEYWVRFEEGAGVKFQPVRRAERLIEFCREVIQSGGKLTPHRAGELIALRQRLTTGETRAELKETGRRAKDK